MHIEKLNSNHLSKKKALLQNQMNCQKNNYFGETLRELRLEKELTQEEASKLVGITQAMWSAYEIGKSRPDLDTIILIAKQLKISPLALIGRSLDKSKYLDPIQELTIEDYETIENKLIDKYRKDKIAKRIKKLI